MKKIMSFLWKTVAILIVVLLIVFTILYIIKNDHLIVSYMKIRRGYYHPILFVLTVLFLVLLSFLPKKAMKNYGKLPAIYQLLIVVAASMVVVFVLLLLAVLWVVSFE